MSKNKGLLGTKAKGKCLTDRQIKKFIRFQCGGDEKDYSKRKETVSHLGLCWDCSQRHGTLLICLEAIGKFPRMNSQLVPKSFLLKWEGIIEARKNKTRYTKKEGIDMILRLLNVVGDGLHHTKKEAAEEWDKSSLKERKELMDLGNNFPWS